MRNLLIVLKILILTLIVAKTPDTVVLKKIYDGQNKVKEEIPVDKQIQTILKDNASKLDEIEKIKMKNDKDIVKKSYLAICQNLNICLIKLMESDNLDFIENLLYN